MMFKDIVDLVGTFFGIIISISIGLYVFIIIVWALFYEAERLVFNKKDKNEIKRRREKFMFGEVRYGFRHYCDDESFFKYEISEQHVHLFKFMCQLVKWAVRIIFISLPFYLVLGLVSYFIRV